MRATGLIALLALGLTACGGDAPDALHVDVADDDGVRVDESRGVNIGGFVPECVEGHGSIVTL